MRGILTRKVGHDESSLTESRTLESLYINPMLEVLEKMNPETPFIPRPTQKYVEFSSPACTVELD